MAARATSGDAVLLVPDGNSLASSPHGHIAYTETAEVRPSGLVLVGRDGETQHTVVAPQIGLGMRASLSPDGKQVAVTINDTDQDIWIYELADGSRRRVIFGEGAQAWPAWAPDGSLAYATGDVFARRPFLRDLNRATDTPICSLAAQDFSFTDDQTYVAFGFQTAQLDWNVGYTNLTTGASHTLVGTLSSEECPALAPNGRYIAYQSDESGRSEIYLQPFPAGDGRWLLSEDGGEEPFWSADGATLYYRARTSLMAVGLTTSPGLVLGEAREVFTRERMDWVGRGTSDDVFLVHELSESVEAEVSIFVWLHWAAGRE